LRASIAKFAVSALAGTDVTAGFVIGEMKINARRAPWIRLLAGLWQWFGNCLDFFTIVAFCTGILSSLPNWSGNRGWL